MVGDFNVKADMPDGWVKKAGIISAGDDFSLPDDYDGSLNKSEDFATFMQMFSDFSGSIETYTETGSFNMKDLWGELLPEEPGFTWIGKDWKVKASNSYGTDGNTVATEKGPPERIDYIFYFDGAGNFKISPQSASLFPQNESGLQISDHLGLQASFKID